MCCCNADSNRLLFISALMVTCWGGVTAMRVHSFVPAICAGFEVAMVV